MKHLDLFSGIGGFALAAKWAGYDTIAFCEIEEYPRKVLKKNFPGVPIFNDIKELHEKDLPKRPDIITGGYPCQPFSTAGKRGGVEDDRHLWPEMFRLIRECSPTWVIGENVVGHVSMGLDKVLTDLESEDYKTRVFIIPACGVDAPHRRDRAWIVAYSNSNSKPGKPINEQREISRAMVPNSISNGKRTNAGAQSRTEKERKKLLKENGKSLSDDVGEVCGAVADNDSLRMERPGAEQQATGADEQDWLHRWPAEPGVGRVANGVPNRVDRLKGLGNAIVPQIAYQIMKSIINLQKQTEVI